MVFKSLNFIELDNRMTRRPIFKMGPELPGRSSVVVRDPLLGKGTKRSKIFEECKEPNDRGRR